MPQSTVALSAIAQNVARQLFSGRFPIVATSDASGGSTSSLLIDDAAYSSASVNAYDGVGIWVVAGTGIQFSRVTRAGFTVATGAFALSPVLGANPNSAATIILTYGFSRADLVDAINYALNNLWTPAYVALSLVTDGHMETAGVGSWAAVLTPTTRVKTTTAANVLYGTQSLSLVSDALSEGATSDAFNVHEGETLLVSVFVQVDAGSVIVTLYNATAASAIQSVTVDQEGWTEVRFSVAVPTGCEQATIRPLSATAASTWYVGPVIVLSLDRSVYDLPTLITDPAALEEPAIWSLPLGRPSEVADSYIPQTNAFQPWPYVKPLFDLRAANALRVQVTQPVNAPLFVKYWRTLADLSADADTTEAPEELVAAGAVAYLRCRQMEGQIGRSLTKRERAEYFKVFYQLRDQYGYQRPMVRYLPAERVSV